MLKMMAAKWWVLLIRGIAAILLGLATLFWPGLTLATALILFAAYAVIDGVMTLFAAIAHRKDTGHWFGQAFKGLTGIILGILIFTMPELAVGVVVFIVATWAIVSGLLEIAAAFQMRKEISTEWWLYLAGAISILFGIYAFFNPGTAAQVLIWFIAGFAIIFGLMLIVQAFRVRKIHMELSAPQTA